MAKSKSIICTLFIAVSLLFSSCESTDELPKIEYGSLGYKEMTYEEYSAGTEAAYQENGDSSFFFKPLYEQGYAGIIITNFAMDKSYKYIDDGFGNTKAVYSAIFPKSNHYDYYNYFKENPDAEECLELNKEYSVQFRIEKKAEGSGWDTRYYYSMYLEKIDSLQTIEEAKAKMAALEKELHEKVAAERKEKDEKGKSLAAGYVYHGIDEDENNCKLFAYDATEVGHAYYVSRFSIATFSNDYGTVKDKSFRVQYKDNATKIAVIDKSDNSGTLFANLGNNYVTVVIGISNDYLKTPVVLGIVE